MTEMYHEYPDVCVTKTGLVKYFPMSQATLGRRLREMRSIRQFRDVEITSAGKLLINVRGFYQFLMFLEKKKKKMI